MPVPSPYDPERDGPYGLWLRGKGVQTNGGSTAPIQRETRDDGGRIVRTVTAPTDSGALTTVRNRTDQRGGTHQDVHVRAPLITNDTVVPRVSA